MSRKPKRMTIDDILGFKSEGIVIEQDKKGKPRVRKPKAPPITYKQKFPIFFKLVRDNPNISDPVEEFRFHPVRKWRIDVCWPDIKLALEIEGGIYQQGKKTGKPEGHRSIKGFLSDMEKYNNLSIHGYSLLRFTPEQMDNCEAYDVLLDWLKIRKNKKNGGKG